jgi:HEAT repeat protein
VPVLVEALADQEPLMRGHAVWALGEIGSAEAVSALAVLEHLVRDPLVRDELEVALARPRLIYRVGAAPATEMMSHQALRRPGNV